MPLATLRKHQRWVLWILVGVTVLVFGLFGTEFAFESILTGRGPSIAGYYRGEPISTDDFAQFGSRWNRFAGGNRERKDELMPLMISVLEAQAAGLQVTDLELRKRLKEIVKSFREAQAEETPGPSGGEVWDNSYDEAYTRLVHRLEMTKGSFEKTLREEILIRKYEEAILSASGVSDWEVRLGFEKENAKIRTRYLNFRSNEFSEFFKPTQDEVMKFFEKNNHEPQSPLSLGQAAAAPGRYFQPNRVAIEYVIVTFNDHEPASIPFDKIEERYKKNRARYRRSEKEAKDGLTGYKGLREVSAEIEKELREEAGKGAARDIMHKIASAWMEAVRTAKTPGNLDGKMEELAKISSAAYAGKTRLFSRSEASVAGPISNARNFAEQAFRIFENREGKEEPSAEDALRTLSDIVMGEDACYLLRVVSKRRNFSPTWNELLSAPSLGNESPLGDLTREKVEEDLKVANGFQRAQEESEKMRQAIYGRAMEALARSLGATVVEFELVRAGDPASDGPSIHASVREVAFQIPVGEVSRPFAGAENRPTLLWVKEAVEEKRKIQVLETAAKSLQDYPVKPSETSLEFLYEMSKSHKDYQQPGEVGVEYLWARVEKFAEKVQATEEEIQTYYEAHKSSFVDVEGKEQPLEKVKGEVLRSFQVERGKAMALDAIEKASQEAVLKSPGSGPSPEIEAMQKRLGRAEELDAIKTIADSNGLIFKKNLEKFRPLDMMRRSGILGSISAAGEIEKLLRDLPLDSWSGIQQCGEGPFLLRVIERGDPSPAPLEEVRELVTKNYLAAWPSRRPEDQLAELWEEQLHTALDQVSELPVIPTKSRRVFRAVTMDTFSRAEPPEDLKQEAEFFTALETLKPGELSPAIRGKEAYFLVLKLDEKPVKMVKIQYGQVQERDFPFEAATVSEEALQAYYEQQKDKEKFKSPERVEIEYIFGDVESAQKEALDKLREQEKEVLDYYELHKTRLYTGLDLLKAKPFIYEDLSLEKGLELLRTRIRSAYEDAMRSTAEIALKAVAEKYKLSYDRTSFSRTETDRLSELDASRDVLIKAFEAKDGECSRIQQTSVTQFFFRRVGITESAVRPLEEVRGEVVRDLLAEQARKAAYAWVATVLERAKTMTLKDAVASVPFPAEREILLLNESDFFHAGSPADLLPSSELRDAAARMNIEDLLGPIESGGNLYFARVTGEKIENQQKISYVSYGMEAFKTNSVTADQEEAKALYEAEKETFRRPDSLRIEYLFGSVPDLAESETIKARSTDAAIAAHYDAKKDTYWRNTDPATRDQKPYLPLEEVRNYVSFDFRVEEAQKMAAGLVEIARERIEKFPEPAKIDFASLASELGIKYGLSGYIPLEGDPEAGAIPRDLQDIPQLSKLAFGLKEGQIIADTRLKTLNGQALIRRQEFRASSIPELSEVRKQVESRVIEQKALQRASEHAAAAREALAQALSSISEGGGKADVFARVVQEHAYLADESFRPAIRTTEYFARPMFSPIFLRYTGSPYYMPAIPGMNRPMGGMHFAREAFKLPRGRVSRPIAYTGKDESECFLLVLSGQSFPSEDEFRREKSEFRQRLEREKSAMAQESWSNQLNQLEKPPTP